MQSALVLGAGVMGLSAAWALSRAGWSVRVVDQDPVPNPRGSSVDDHRLIRHAYGAATGYMRMIDPAFAAWDLLFAEAGERPYVPTGVLALANGPGGWLAESRAALRGDGHAVTELDAATVAARHPFLMPDGIAAAFHLPSGGVLLARRIVELLARRLAARGIDIRRGQAIAVDPAHGAVTLADGVRLQADLLVFAAGPWAPRLVPGLAARVRPTRQIIVRLAPPPEHEAAWQSAPMLLDLAGDGGFYAVPPVAGTPLKIGDHRFAPTTDPDAPREATAAEAAEILGLARHRIRDLESYRVISAAACYYDVEAEERFVVERLGERAFVMSGFSGHGFKFGALLGLALARAAGDPALAPGLAGWAAGATPPPPGLLADLEQEQAA
ncbi:FAD-dependent oxidoreductase [Roseomonas frigidaquae]|uniref:FAD-dependent oxidoreductase n=1 Tax=Falsiroseomonas frigidaquae TaxID=487318 RepID=A0ABX1EY81_9PROT|nr:FAD-dependent oxidoreductase [Falsiroseomonas frigidaquae]NKE45053.1 FAD-dependent oxidoreductase [Falsiroseomonas frigidaquae]